MICDNCRPWCAVTNKQLTNRLYNMTQIGNGVVVHTCPQCGGIEWATTDEMIRQETPKRWWQFWKTNELA